MHFLLMQGEIKINSSTLFQTLFKKCSNGRLRRGKCDLDIKPHLNTFKPHRKQFIKINLRELFLKFSLQFLLLLPQTNPLV